MPPVAARKGPQNWYNNCFAVIIPRRGVLWYNGHLFGCRSLAARKGPQNRYNNCFAVIIPRRGVLWYNGHLFGCRSLAARKGPQNRYNNCFAVIIPRRGVLWYNGHLFGCRLWRREKGRKIGIITALQLLYHNRQWKANICSTICRLQGKSPRLPDTAALPAA